MTNRLNLLSGQWITKKCQNWVSLPMQEETLTAAIWCQVRTAYFLAVLSVMPPKIKSDLLLCLTVNWGLYAIFAFQERHLTGCKITVWPQSWQELHHFSCGCSCSLWKHALSVIMLMEKSLIMDVWIWMCFAKGTSARLYKHCPNLQEATKVMTPPPPHNHVGPLTLLSTNTVLLSGA